MADTLDRSDAPVVTEKRADGKHYRRVYEPTAAGAWQMVEQQWTGATWRTLGTRQVASLGFENLPPEVIDND